MTTSGAGPAAGVRWDLSDLYAGPDDARIDADLDRALGDARAFEARHRAKVADLSAAQLAEALDALEALNALVARGRVQG